MENNICFSFLATWVSLAISPAVYPNTSGKIFSAFSCSHTKPYRLKLCCGQWELHTKFIKEALLLSHRVQKGPLCSLNFFLDRSLDVAGYKLSPRFVNSLCLKDYVCVIELCPARLRVANQIYLYKYIWFIMITIRQKDINQNYLLDSIGVIATLII